MKHTLALLSLLAAPAAAQSTLDEIVQLEVLPGWETADGTQMAGVRIALAPGWKTYWRAPGDGGIPPRLDLSQSQNVAGARFHWPVPEVFDQNGIRSIGYHDQVVLPLEVAPKGDGHMHLTGELEIGVCEEICIPVRVSFDTVLPPDGGRDPAIVAALVNRPMSAEEAGVSAATCRLSPSETGMSITAELTIPQVGANEIVVIETPDPQIWVSESDVTRTGETITATSDMVHMVADSFALDRAGLRFTVIGDNRAVDIRGCSAG